MTTTPIVSITDELIAELEAAAKAPFVAVVDPATILALLAERAELKKMLAHAIAAGRRAIGDHYAPGDCYATGPLTGDPFRDLVECPACAAIALFDHFTAMQESRP